MNRRSAYLDLRAKTFALLILGLAVLTRGQWSEQSPILQASDEVDDAFFGYSVALDGNVAVIGAYDWFNAVGRGRAYVSRANGSSWVEEQILQASDDMEGIGFGGSVAVSGNVAVVGAPLHPSGGTLRGQVYVFHHNGTAWVEEQILQASDEADNAAFGSAIAVSGNAIVVGAYRRLPGGQAYVFRYNGSAWVEEQILKASDEAAGAVFGFSVAIDGTTAVVGAVDAPSGGLARGQAYVFRYNGTSWAEEQILRASNEQDYVGFGFAVAVNGNVAAATLHPGSGGHHAYIYRRSGSTWTEEKILQASDHLNATYFGVSIGLSGGLSGDVAVVGAFGHASGGTMRGKAYLYRYNGVTWPEEQILQASDQADNANFGRSVAISGNTTVIGSPGHPSGGTGRGQAYIFSGPATTPTPTPSPSPSPTATPTATPVVTPEIDVTPLALSFGNKVTSGGPTTDKTVTINNIGGGTLSISSVSITGTNPLDFIIISDTGQTTLPPAGTRTVKVVFDPNDPTGAKSAQLTILSNDSNEATVNVSLTGTGLTSNPKQIFGYYPANDHGRGRAYFVDKAPPSGVKSYRIELRRVNDASTVFHQAVFNLAGPPTGDVTQSTEFDLPLNDVGKPTSYEIDLQFRFFAYDGQDAAGNVLFQSAYGYGSHPSADVAGLVFTAPPLTASDEPMNLSDNRPTGSISSFAYDILRILRPSGTQSYVKSFSHGLLGPFQTFEVHPLTSVSQNIPVVSGKQDVLARVRRQYNSAVGTSIGRFDVSHSSPITSITVP